MKVSENNITHLQVYKELVMYKVEYLNFWSSAEKRLLLVFL